MRGMTELHVSDTFRWALMILQRCLWQQYAKPCTFERYKSTLQVITTKLLQRHPAPQAVKCKGSCLAHACRV